MPADRYEVTVNVRFDAEVKELTLKAAECWSSPNQTQGACSFTIETKVGEIITPEPAQASVSLGVLALCLLARKRRRV